MGESPRKLVRREIDWQVRVKRLVQITCDTKLSGMPFFDHNMLMLEHRVAEPKHHRRAYDELADRWLQVFAACADLQPQPSAATVHALLTAAWGGRHYRLLVQPEASDDAWVTEMEAVIIARLTDPFDRPRGSRALSTRAVGF